ncbi:MAG: ABC transporter ATP-binding protein [Leptolyngbya sp. SIO1D8]|nr:ABC transporter ATP-binding protein [Leptolyngbya sp. SIO1D8]
MSANHLLVKLSKQSFGWMFASIVLGFSGAIFNGIGTTLMIPLILDFLGSDITQSDNFPPILKAIFSTFDIFPEQYRSLAMIGCVLLAIVLKNLATYANAITSGILGRRFTASLRREGFRLLLDVDIDYFCGIKLGELMSYINTEVNRATAAVRSLVKIAISSITILVFIAFLVLMSWQLTLLATVLLGAVAFINQLSMKHAKAVGRELSKSAAALSSRAIEVLSGIRLVKSVANEDIEYSTIDKLIARRENAEYRSQLLNASVGPINEVSSIFALILLIIIGRTFFGNQMQAIAPIMLAYLAILFRMFPFIGQLNTARNKLANSSASVEIIDNFLKRSNKPFMPSNKGVFNGLERGIRFKELWFKYPTGDGWSLQNIDLVLPKGQTLALVGSSGAGKSTMADLLARFYDPTKGQIEIDGIDLKEFGIHSYRKNIGIVSQDTFLFNASVKDNIRYGRASATDEEVFQAAKRANAAEFIQKLPEGFDTMIGDRGILLSGGQRQRLAIARALLQDPEILILDEATSALDTVSERLVQQALEDLSQERTTLVIAHRLSTVQKADKIAVLEKGKVVEVGTHQELLNKGDYYANLYSIQFSGHEHGNGKFANGEALNAQNFDRASYEIRSQLNGMIGVLGLLDDDMVDNPSEYEELVERAYQSAVNVLKSLEQLEKDVLPVR